MEECTIPMVGIVVDIAIAMAIADQGPKCPRPTVKIHRTSHTQRRVQVFDGFYRLVYCYLHWQQL